MGVRNGEAVTFQGWMGGDYGIMDPREAAKSDAQMFSGSDVIVYKSGLIGPAPNGKTVSFTSPPNGRVLAGSTWITSGVKFFALTETASGYEWRIWDIDAGTVGSTFTGTFASSVPAAIAPSQQGGFGAGGYYNISGSGLYKVLPDSAAVSLIDTDPSGALSTFYGDRLVANNNNRLWYSDVLDWDTFGANNYVDVGAAVPHSLYTKFRDGLLVSNLGGVMIFVTGVLGATTTIRELSSGGGPWTGSHWVDVAADKVWYFNGPEYYPSSWNGAVHERFKYLERTPRTATISDKIPSLTCLVTDWAGPDAWVGYSTVVDTEGIGGRSFLYQNGVFTFHDRNADYVIPFGGLGSAHLLITDNGTGSPPTFEWWAPGLLERPSIEGDDYGGGLETTGSKRNCWFKTPVWSSDAGLEVRVAQVIIEWKAWDTGVSTDPGFDVSVITTASPADGDTETAVQSVSIPYADADSDGVDRRAVLNFGAGWGNGFQINVTNLYGAAIRRITAVLSPDTRRP